MVLITKTRYEYFQEYLNLLDKVEEGIAVVDWSYQEKNYHSGDKILQDLFEALGPFKKSIHTMQYLFSYDKKMEEHLNNFQLIEQQVSHLRVIFHNEEEKTRFIHEFFSPAYKKWKKQVCRQLLVYIKN
ncbi:hypothetical protein DS745_07725 [Anaerobacillus alkaliphilus]|uniref:DUF8042 domain-containing protein n=1 Tax=Anaerobacillus alkaliphilus TaxID=1548597 RepID=A0A4V1LGM4_9BACI|nr:hypothetical protein [Anaerobacillus alkaliphilus]RXJ02269.1 hypothetical protein DS745_07725 [Anaerobacillus alkaliphilus]